MTWNQNPANDYADGIPDGPTREEIEEAVLDFDDANNGYGAYVNFLRDGDYEIWVATDQGTTVVSFDRLWEFKDWVCRQDLAAERELVSA